MWDSIFGSKRKSTIDDLSISLKAGTNRIEVMEDVVKTLIASLKEKDLAITELNEEEDRKFAKGLGLTDAQYEAIRDRWFSKWDVVSKLMK